jgi:hypothetical protein
MSTERPLRVEVAEALGWTEIVQHEGGKWYGREPWGHLNMVIPSYDHSWCSSGPLLERMGISLDHAPNQPEAKWSAYSPLSDHADGKTPCEAVARLIVQLAKEGKLPK